MALTVALTPAERLLLRGPTPLKAYAAETFPWLHALRRGPIDWNTLLTLPIRADRLADIANFFLAPLPPAPTTADPHATIRKAAGFLLQLSDLLARSQALLDDAVNIDITALYGFKLEMEQAEQRIEERSRQEWTAWLYELDSLIQEEAHIMAKIRQRLKRQADAAELAATPRPAPVVVADE